MRPKLFALALFVFWLVPVLAADYFGTPAEDAWAYKRSGNPGGSPQLRTWGDGVTDIEDTWPASDSHSYGYIKWDLSGTFNTLPEGQYWQVTRATLTVWQVAGASYTKADGEMYPLLARPLADDWHEQGFSFNPGAEPVPGSPILGAGDLSNYNQGAAFAITINLLQYDEAAFQAFFNDVVKGNKFINFALTSKIVGPAEFYKYSSREDAQQYRPVLEISATAVPEPGLLALVGAAVIGLVLRRMR
jgi:hypothetical protein